MNDVLFDIGYGHFLVLAALLFAIGMVGMLIRRNALIMLMSAELMLNAANISLVVFARMWGGVEALGAHTFALIVIGVAAAEASVGLAIVVAVFRGRHSVEVDHLTLLRH
jgi:NADH-quinone oxidoreductase subunit K